MKNILLALLMLTATSACAESYLCIADQAAGFSFNKGQKKWSATTFKVNEKFIIKRPTSEQITAYVGAKAAWVVTGFGSSSDFPVSFCAKDFSDSGGLFCEGLETFQFNKKTMRFLSVYAIGYVSDTPDSKFSEEGKNTPSMQIGTCSLI